MPMPSLLCCPGWACNPPLLRGRFGGFRSESGVLVDVA
jgi:hypothetical protein